MNKKSLFSIFILFICLFSCSSCFGATDHGFTLEFIESCVNNYSSEIKSFINEHNFKNYLITSEDTSLFIIRFSEGTFSIGSYMTSSTGWQGSMCFKPDGSYYKTYYTDSKPSYTKNDYIHASSQNELCSDRINSLDILMGFVEPEPVQPFIEISKTEYTENDISVDLYVYPNDFDITDYGLVFTRYDGESDSVGTTNYFSPLPSKWQEYYNSAEIRYELNLKDFLDFSFSDVIFYDVGIFEYNSSGDNTPYQKTEQFKYKFSESYEVAPGGTFDITPIIYLSTEQSTTSLTVTIGTVDVSKGNIYYKIDDGVWNKYYSGFEVFENCTVYAHIYTSDGHSGYSSRTISNIVSFSEFEERPNIKLTDIKVYKLPTFDDTYRFTWDFSKFFDKNYRYMISNDGSNFLNVVAYDNEPSNYVYSFNLKVRSYPRRFYFRIDDVDTGLFSDIFVVNIYGEDDITYDPELLPSYDENNKYDPDNVIDFETSKDVDDKLQNNGLDFSSSENLVESAKNSMETTWGLFNSFFNLIHGIWIFIPTEIMYLLISFIIIKFIIAVIGFIRG